jgi:zinc/manganese transport system substrate-binding protein
VQRNRLRALLGEPSGANRPFQALASDLGVSIGVFDPIETTSEQAARDPATYFLVMRRNVTNLRQAFGG